MPRHLPAILGLAMTITAPAALAEGRSVIVLDGSGSMWGQIDGRPKLEIAREALAEVLAGVAPQAELGLMAYGHREKGSCTDIEMIVPPATGTGPAISQAAANMRFLGKTPLSEAVRRAAETLRHTEEKATVILITDGIETCNADPCALGTELEQSGVDFTAHVVGFGLTQDEGRQVACLAENTGGRYIEAKDAGDLSQALRETVAAAPQTPAPAAQPSPPPVVLPYSFAPRMVLTEGGDALKDDGQSYEIFAQSADGERGERVALEYGEGRASLPPGRYIVEARIGQAVQEQVLEIEPDQLAEPLFVMNAGRLVVRPLGEAGGDPVEGAPIEVVAGAASFVDYGGTDTIVPAGPVSIQVTVGLATATAETEVRAGEVTTLDIVAAAGSARFALWLAEGVPAGDDQVYEVLAAAPAADGSHEVLRTDYGAGIESVLAPGDYILRGRSGEAMAEVPFTVKAGETVDVAVTLNAGIAALEAPGATVIETFRAEAGLDGNRPSVRYDYGEAVTLVLPAGDYVAVATKDEQQAETAFSVRPGQRSEARVTLP